jgi:hypothetical protein
MDENRIRREFFSLSEGREKCILVEILSLDVTDSYLLKFSPDDLTTDAAQYSPTNFVIGVDIYTFAICVRSGNTI